MGRIDIEDDTGHLRRQGADGAIKDCKCGSKETD